jgi:hypothetical protein
MRRKQFLGRRYRERLVEEDARVREGIIEAADLVESLLVESGVLGQAIGQPQPPRIRKHAMPPEADLLRDFVVVNPGLGLSWFVEPATPGPVRFGSLVVTWVRLEPRPGKPAPERNSNGEHTGYYIDADVELTIEADPPLSWDLPVHENTRPSKWRHWDHYHLSFAAGDRSARLSYVTAIHTDEQGNMIGSDTVQIGRISPAITFIRGYPK